MPVTARTLLLIQDEEIQSLLAQMPACRQAGLAGANYDDIDDSATCVHLCAPMHVFGEMKTQGWLPGQQKGAMALVCCRMSSSFLMMAGPSTS
ncbi:hypothetical protein D9M71_474190 [compost metagenome]